MNRTHLLIIATTAALGLTATAASAADTGGQRLVSRKGNCQMTVPSNWKTDSLIKSMASAPGHGSVASAVISTGPDGYGTLAKIKPIVQGTMVPTKTIEDSPQRLWYAYQGNGQQTGWYVGVPSHGHVCGAQITFNGAAQESLAKSIALSVGPVP